MGFLDIFRRRPAPEPETPAERDRREVANAVTLLRARGFEPAGPRPVGRTDSLISATMGMGIDTLDKRTTIQPSLRPFWGLDALDALYMQGGLFRRISSAPATSAISGGWRVDTKRGQDVTTEFDRRLGLRKKLLDATRYGRAYGRGHVMVIIEGDRSPLNEPLPPGPHKIKALQVLMRRECIPFRWSSDLGSDLFGDVDLWNVTPTRIGVFAPSTPVHASRILTVRGLDAPLTPVGGGFDLGRGLSVPDAYWEEIRDLVAVWASLSTSALEMSTPVITIGAHNEANTGDDRDDYRAVLQLLKLSRSAWGMTVKSGSDEFERDNVNFAGIKEVVTALQERVCALEGIPATKIFGQAPGGLSTDDASGRASYSDLIDGLREDHIEPALHQLYDIAFGPEDRTMVWAPLDSLTPREQAEIDNINADRDIKLIAAKVITRAESRARYEGDEVLPMPVVVGEYEEDDLELDEPTETDPDPLAREDADTYAVPEGARGNARRVLRWREEHGDEVKGMTSVGWRRARQLASNARVGYDTVAAMAAFNRHRQNAEVAPEHKGEPWKDAGHVAWLGWGGTTGVDWARKITGAAD